MPGPARRSRRTRNEPPEIGVSKADGGEHQSQDQTTQETMDDDNHKEDPEDHNDESEEEGQSQSQEKQRARKRDESPKKTVVAATTRRSKRVRKPTSRSSSRVSSPVHPGTKTKVRGRTTAQSDDQQSKDTDETNASANDEAMSSSSSSSSSSSEDEDEDKSKHSQGAASRRQPRRSKRARLYPTPDDPSRSEEKADQDNEDKKEKSRGDESCASSTSERKKPDVHKTDNDNDDDDFSDNEPLSVLMKRKKEKLKKMTVATTDAATKDSTEGNDHSREAPPKRPISSAASSVADENDDDKESSEDAVKPPNDTKRKQRRKRQATTTTTTTTTATTIDTSHRSSEDEHDDSGPPLKKKRARKAQSSKKSVSDPSTNDELSSDESLVKGGKRSTRSRRRKENAASRAIPSTIQEQDENDEDKNNNTNVTVSNDVTKPEDHEDENKKGKKRLESKRTTRQRSDSHADDEASEEMQGTVESSRRSQRKRRKPRKLGGDESSDEENVAIKEQTATETETVKEEDSPPVTNEPQPIDVGQEHDESPAQPSPPVENADIKLDTGDDKTQSSTIDSKKETNEQQTDDNIETEAEVSAEKIEANIEIEAQVNAEKIEANVSAETIHVNPDNIEKATVDECHIVGTAETNESANNSVENDAPKESVSAETVEGMGEDSEGSQSIPDQSKDDTPTKINPTSEEKGEIEGSGADISREAENLSDVVNVDSIQHETSLDSPEPTNEKEQGSDRNREAQPTVPLEKIGDHHQIVSHESPSINLDSLSHAAKDETTPVSENVDDDGRQAARATLSMSEEEPQTSESPALNMENSGKTEQTAVEPEKDALIVTSSDGEASPETRKQDEVELLKQSSNSNESCAVELEVASLRNGEENEHKNEEEAVDLSHESKTVVDAENDIDTPGTIVVPSEKHSEANDLHASVQDKEVHTDDTTQEMKVETLVRDEMVEVTPDSEEHATKLSKKDEDEENDHFHDAQMELPPEPQISQKVSPVHSEIAGDAVPQGQQTVVEESLDEELEATAQVTAPTTTEEKGLDENQKVAHSILSVPATAAVSESEEQLEDKLSPPLISAQVQPINSEVAVVPLSSLPHFSSSGVDSDVNAIPNTEKIDAEPQTEVISVPKMDSPDDSKPSGDGSEISIVPTNEASQMTEDTLRVQEGPVGTTQQKSLSTDIQTENEELKTSGETVLTENDVKGAFPKTVDGSNQDLLPKSPTHPQASDKMEESQPTISSDQTEHHVLPNTDDVDASVPAAPPDIPAEELNVDPDGSTSEAKLPTIQSLAAEGGPNAKSSPELWTLPFDLDHKVIFGPSVAPVSKLPNKTRIDGVYGSDADKMKRVKAALYAAGSKAHRGAGFERIFAEYWDAMALRLSDRLSSHTSERCQKAIDNFLTTSKLRKLHNRFVISILRRATKSMAVYDEISSHLPSKWRNRISVICDEVSDPPAEKLNESDLLVNYQHDPLEPVYREAWFQDQPDPKPIGNESRRQKTLVGPKNEATSCSIPGALTVDPLVRKIAEECDMQVSELAVWMMVVAVREHTTNILRAALSQKEGMEQQELVPRTLKFPNFLANATKPPPKKDSNQELGKAGTTEKTARAQRKLTVLDVYAGSSSMPCGNIGSLGGSLSRDVLERSLHAAFDYLPVVPKDDFVQVQHFITEQIFGEARTRKIPTKAKDDERETRTDDNRNLNVTMKQRNSFAVPAPAPAQTRQPQVVPQAPVKAEGPQQAAPIEVKENTSQDIVTPTTDAATEDDSGQKSLPRGMGRGAKDLAALMRRTSNSTPPVQENVPKEADGPVSVAAEVPTTTQNTPDETLEPDSANAVSHEESGMDGEDAMGQRRGKGFGIKNLAAMRARAGTSNNDPQPSNNAS